MVNIVYGPAGSGKTSYILDLIKKEGQNGRKSMLIVPEQYSHDAERSLCAVCGNGVSLYSEVISFSRLCLRMTAQGTAARKNLDAGGRILVMTRALNLVLPELKAFRNIRKKADFAAELVGIYSELRTCCVRAEDLMTASEEAEGMLSDKLRDLSLIFAAYESYIPDDMRDPSDALDELAEAVKASDIGNAEHIYIDGFTDFTAQEKIVIGEFIKKGTDVTVCLTCDDIDDPDTAFELPAATARYLLRFAASERQYAEITAMDESGRSQPEDLRFFGRNMFSYGAEIYDGKCENIELYKAETPAQECELAAGRILELVREKGYRWKDFAVAVRDWDSWATTAENVFAQYGIPLQLSEKGDISEKPIMAVVFAALDIIINDWDYKSVFKYLKTGMTAIPTEDIDILENYILKWNIRGGSMWKREEPWTYNPEGYVQEMTEKQRQVLARVNEIKCEVAESLAEFEKKFKAGKTVKEKITALYDFMAAIDLPARLEKKAQQMRDNGNLQLCDEYLQLWDILITGFEQYADVMGDEEADEEEFAAMFRLLISQYEIGTIPASIDRVTIGDMMRTKRRDVKCFILMGMTEDAVPKVSKASYILSDDERDELEELGLSVSDTVQSRISREMNMIYTLATLPKQLLVMSYNTAQGRGKASFVVLAAEQMFSIQAKTVGDSVKINAVMPCLELAVGDGAEKTLKAAAAEYFRMSELWGEKCRNAEKAAAMPRGSLTRDTAEKLYSKKINITASRVDKYYSCRFAYFMQYGLRAKPRTAAGFDAPEAGTFMHYILENVAAEAEKMGGFGKIDETDCRALTKKYVEEYINTTLNGFEDKTDRFKYLFRRLAADAELVVLDMAGELARSDFRPVDFELKFAPDGQLPPAKIKDDEIEVNIVGVVDRADGWVHDDKLYLRVVDYKTGRKAFSLSDIWYGMGMQMLIYLFVLQRTGDARYGKEIVPAGVMYAPARDLVLSMPRGSTDEEIEKARADKLRRSGLLLSDPEIIEAMEHGNAPKYLPVRFKKDGSISSDYIAGLERLGKLSRHIDDTLLRMGKELRLGKINADPYYRNAQDNACVWCDYYEACHFNEAGAEDKIRYLRRLKTPEAWEKIEGEEKN